MKVSAKDAIHPLKARQEVASRLVAVDGASRGSQETFSIEKGQVGRVGAWGMGLFALMGHRRKEWRSAMVEERLENRSLEQKGGRHARPAKKGGWGRRKRSR